MGDMEGPEVEFMQHALKRAWSPPSGSETRHCPHQLARGKRCHELQWSSQAPHLRFPVRSCLPICHRGWTIAMRSCSRPSRLGSGAHPEAHIHDVASADQRLNSRYGLRGVRVGKASHPGPASKRRRTQRLRGVPWSWDSDCESSSDDIHRPTLVDSVSEDDQPLVRPVRVPPDVVETLEHDLCEQCLDPGTTQLSSLASVVPTTVPASSGGVHRVGAQLSGATPVAIPRSVRDSKSDTDSVPGIDRRTRRRLRLVWRSHTHI